MADHCWLVGLCLAVLLTELGIHQSQQRTVLSEHMPAKFRDDRKGREGKPRAPSLSRIDRPHFRPAFVELPAAGKGCTVSETRKQRVCRQTSISCFFYDQRLASKPLAQKSKFVWLRKAQACDPRCFMFCCLSICGAGRSVRLLASKAIDVSGACGACVRVLRCRRRSGEATPSGGAVAIGRNRTVSGPRDGHLLRSPFMCSKAARTGRSKHETGFREFVFVCIGSKLSHKSDSIDTQM